MSAAVTVFGGLLVVTGLVAIGFGIFAMIRGGRDDPEYGGGLGPISERGIHILAGARIIVVGLLCIAAGLYALYRIA